MCTAVVGKRGGASQIAHKGDGAREVFRVSAIMIFYKVYE